MNLLSNGSLISMPTILSWVKTPAILLGSRSRLLIGNFSFVPCLNMNLLLSLSRKNTSLSPLNLSNNMDAIFSPLKTL